MSDAVVVSLETMAKGAVLERFDRELTKVIRNILDPNTEAKAVRKIKIELVLKPDEDRESADIQVKTSSSEAPPRAISSRVYIGRRNGEPVAVEFDPRQPDLFTHGEPDVVPLNRREEA